MSTAAVVIVGNEVLTGKFADENGPYLIGRLRTLGCDLVRLVTIPDEVAVIADEVRLCAARADHVFTSGGVGPTHDDVTFEGVARAFDVALELRAELIDLVAAFGLPRNDGTERMARVPVGAELLFHEALSYPVVRVRNAYVLPGVPKLFKNKFEAIASRFAGEAVGVARVYTDENEWDLAERLTAIANRWPSVAIGSYPRWGEGPFHVILTLESRDRAALASALAEIRRSFRTIARPS